MDADDVPVDIRRAVAGLWVLAVLSMLGLRITVDLPDDAPAWQATALHLGTWLIGFAVIAGINLFFTHAIERRKLWARRALTVLLILSLAINLPHLNADFAAAVAAALVGLKVYVLYCLYCSAGKQWFTGAVPPAPT